MTEKRFVYEYDEYCGTVFDTQFNTFHHMEDSEENIELFCRRLNKIHEENQHLKKMNELLFAEIRWNKEQRLKSRDMTPRLTPKELRERVLHE